jgi:hypothetical protein
VQWHGMNLPSCGGAEVKRRFGAAGGADLTLMCNNVLAGMTLAAETIRHQHLASMAPHIFFGI